MVSFVFGSILQQLFLRYIQPQHSHFQGSLTKPLWCGVVKGMVHKSLGVHSVSGSTLHFRCCVGILGPHNKLPETGWFKTTEIDFFFFFAILEGESPESRCCRLCSVWRVWGRCLPAVWLMVVVGHPRPSSSWRCTSHSLHGVSPLCPLVFVWPSYKDRSHWIQSLP